MYGIKYECRLQLLKHLCWFPDLLQVLCQTLNQIFVSLLPHFWRRHAVESLRETLLVFMTLMSLRNSFLLDSLESGFIFMFRALLKASVGISQFRRISKYLAARLTFFRLFFVLKLQVWIIVFPDTLLKIFAVVPRVAIFHRYRGAVF